MKDITFQKQRCKPDIFYHLCEQKRKPFLFFPLLSLHKLQSLGNDLMLQEKTKYLATFSAREVKKAAVEYTERSISLQGTENIK